MYVSRIGRLVLGLIGMMSGLYSPLFSNEFVDMDRTSYESSLKEHSLSVETQPLNHMPSTFKKSNCQLNYTKLANLQGFLLPDGTLFSTDAFGYSEAYNGRYLFISAPGAAVGPAPVSGAVYVFYLDDNNQWVFTQVLTTNGAIDEVGYFTIKSVGNYLFVSAIGTPLGDVNGSVPTQNFSGSLLIYQLAEGSSSDSGPGVWQLVQVLDRNTPGLEQLNSKTLTLPAANFGLSFDVNLESNWLFVGARGQNITNASGQSITGAGAVYGFRLNPSTNLWELNQVLTNPIQIAINNSFGYTVALNGQNLMIADYPFSARSQNAAGQLLPNGTVYVYEGSNRSESWTYVQQLNGDQDLSTSNGLGVADSFGFNVSIDGDWAIIAAPTESLDVAESGRFQGAAYFYYHLGNRWIKTQKVVSDDFNTLAKTTGFYFALINGDVAILSDSNRAGPVGPSQGGILVYKLNRRGTWQQQPTLFDPNSQADSRFGTGGTISNTVLYNGLIGKFINGANANPRPLGSVSIFLSTCQTRPLPH